MSQTLTFRLARRLTVALLALAVHGAFAADATPNAVLRFDVSRFDVSGNTLLATAEVDAALAPFIGKQRDFGDVQRALEALEAAFHRRGYSVVQVELPEQELNGGVIKLRVVQTKIGRVKVLGNTVFDEANIRRSLPALQEGRTPNLKAVSAALKLANENPAKKVAMKLASGEADDEVDATLEVTDEREWKPSLNIDNTGTSSTGKTHVGVVLQHANLWGRDHVASVQYTTTAEKPSQVSVFGAGYHVPLYALGDSLDLFASYSNVDSGTVQSGLYNLQVSGKGATYGLRYNQVLPKRELNESRLAWGLDVKAFKNVLLYSGLNYGKDITVHPLSLTYSGQWMLGAGEADLSAGLERNVPGGSKGGSDDFSASRVGASPNFTVLHLAAALSHSYASQWQSRFIVNAQYTRDALIAGEQFGAGGAASVRGFTERQLSADSGINANAELYTPELADGVRWQCRVLGFVDTAWGRRNEAQAGELVSTGIASIGLGLRLSLGTAASLQLDGGHILRAGATGSTDKNRLHLRAGFSY